MKKTVQGKRASDPDRREPVDGVCLEDLAYTIDHLGDSQLVIEDDALLESGAQRQQLEGALPVLPETGEVAPLFQLLQMLVNGI